MTALKVSLVLAAALACVFAMRRQPAAARHWLLSIAIVCAGLMPLFEVIAPAWGFQLLSTTAFPHAVESERDLLRLTWTAGVAIASASLLFGLARLAWIAARARRDVPDEWVALVRDLSGAVGVERRVRIVECEAPAMPVTWGLFRPSILLPSAARTWSADRLRAVVAHELVHVQRGDWAMHLVAEIAACVYWFNPLMWMARRRLRFESDRACDDAVLGLGVSGTDYAAQLVGVARALRDERRAWTAAPAMARATQLERRVAAALDVAFDRAPASAASSLLALASLLALTLPIAGFTSVVPPPIAQATPLFDVQRNIMLRFGAQERRLSIAAGDVSFWKNRIEGRVELQARLGVDGSLSAVRVLEPVHPDLATAAAAIVRQWRREPALVRGVPVEVPIRMTVDFTR